MELQKGSKGTEVANLQRFLISQGYKLDADGDFGLNTEQATQRWQLKNKLVADGIFGEKSFALAETQKTKTIGSQQPKITPTSLNAIPKLQKVHRNLASKATDLLLLATSAGYELTIVQGLRTFAEQDALFAKRPKVTNARGGQSMHNYGLAVDFAFIVNGKINWDEKLYSNIGKWANDVGLEWGGNWKHFKDLPHCQLKGLPSYKELLPIYHTGGLQAVWNKYQG